MGKIVPYSGKFDYSGLAEADARELREIAARTRERLHLLTITVFDIGRDLIAVQDRLGWGKFEAWCDLEFGRSSRLARHCKAVVERLGDNSEIFSDLPRTVLYKLASPSIPQEVLDSVITQVRSGAQVTLKDIAALVAAHRGGTGPEPQSEQVDDESWTLERAVRTVSPALYPVGGLKGAFGTGTLWFTGRTVMAYNRTATQNLLAIEAPFESEIIQGGVIGRLLPFFTGTLGRFEFIPGQVAGEAALRLVPSDGACRVRTPVLPLEYLHEHFASPELPEAPTARFDGAFPTAIGKVLKAQPRGDIAVCPGGGRLWIGAMASIPLPSGWNAKPMFLSRAFCERLVSLCPEGGDLFFLPQFSFLGDDVPAIVAVAPSGVRVWCTLLNDEEPGPVSAEIPEPLDLSADPRAMLKLLISEAQRLQRLAVIARESKGHIDGQKEYEKGVVHLTIDGEAMRMWVGTEENPTIEIKLRLGLSYPRVRVAVDAERLSRGLTACDSLAVSKRFLAMMSHDGMIYLIPAVLRAATGDKERPFVEIAALVD